MARFVRYGLPGKAKMIEPEYDPTYGVELTDALPLEAGGTSQSMPSRADIEHIRHQGGHRIAASFELLLRCYRNLLSENERLKSASAETVCGEDLTELARSLGFSWPATPADQWRVLKQIAEMARHWRGECELTESGVRKERMYQHLQSRCQAVTRKLLNTRVALRDYKASQACFVRVGLARIKRHEDLVAEAIAIV